MAEGELENYQFVEQEAVKTEKESYKFILIRHLDRLAFLVGERTKEDTKASSLSLYNTIYMMHILLSQRTTTEYKREAEQIIKECDEMISPSQVVEGAPEEKDPLAYTTGRAKFGRILRHWVSIMAPEFSKNGLRNTYRVIYDVDKNEYEEV